VLITLASIDCGHTSVTCVVCSVCTTRESYIITTDVKVFQRGFRTTVLSLRFITFYAVATCPAAISTTIIDCDYDYLVLHNHRTSAQLISRIFGIAWKCPYIPPAAKYCELSLWHLITLASIKAFDLSEVLFVGLLHKFHCCHMKLVLFLIFYKRACKNFKICFLKDLEVSFNVRLFMGLSNILPITDTLFMS
jgi:hypothetical protein